MCRVDFKPDFPFALHAMKSALCTAWETEAKLLEMTKEKKICDTDLSLNTVEVKALKSRELLLVKQLEEERLRSIRKEETAALTIADLRAQLRTERRINDEARLRFGRFGGGYGGL